MKEGNCAAFREIEAILTSRSADDTLLFRRIKATFIRVFRSEAILLSRAMRATLLFRRIESTLLFRMFEATLVFRRI